LNVKLQQAFWSAKNEEEGVNPLQELHRILLTNDDGIYAEGLRSLAGQLHGLAEITVVAPDHERSASGHSITMHRPLRASTVSHFYPQGIKAWAIDGTPADCVKLGVEGLIDPAPEMVISGINRGSNLGTDVLYSGTVSAALEAAILGLPAVAVSLTTFDNPDYGPAAALIRQMFHFLIKNVPPARIFNINVPSLPQEKIQGVRITRLGKRHYRNPFHKRKDPRGRSYYWLAGELEEETEPGSDSRAIEEGFVSITPISFDLTDNDLMAMADDWMALLKEDGIS